MRDELPFMVKRTLWTGSGKLTPRSARILMRGVCARSTTVSLRKRPISLSVSALINMSVKSIEKSGNEGLGVGTAATPGLLGALMGRTISRVVGKREGASDSVVGGRDGATGPLRSVEMGFSVGILDGASDAPASAISIDVGRGDGMSDDAAAVSPGVGTLEGPSEKTKTGTKPSGTVSDVGTRLGTQDGTSEASPWLSCEIGDGMLGTNGTIGEATGASLGDGMMGNNGSIGEAAGASTGGVPTPGQA
jgi:hypothetical protein